MSSPGASTSGLGPISSQYAAAATVPLIKSPSLWMPKPIELPNDIHPLPADITAYFVYPFTLEQHVISQHPSPHEAIAQRRAKNASILHRREVEEEQKERDAIHRIAPGYNPSGLLLPTSANSASTAAFAGHQLNLMDGTPTSTQDPLRATAGASADPMDDLVSRLEEMESKRS